MISTQLETFSSCLAEFAPLSVLHWQDVGDLKESRPLELDFNFYALRELEGRLRFITLRDNGALAGYWLGIVTPSHPHYASSPTAVTDADWIRPASRWAALWLYRKVDEILLAEGIEVLYQRSKLHNRKTALLERLGFQVNEIGLIKPLALKVT